MKRLFLMTCILIIAGSESYSQSCAVKVPGEQGYRTLHWAKRSLLFPTDWFDADTVEILQQVHPDEFRQIKQYSDMRRWPGAAVLSPGDMRDTASAYYKDYYSKLCALTMHPVLTFRHHGPDGTDWGNFIVFRINYEENKTFDTASAWKVFYFIFPEEAVRIVPQE